MTTSRLAADIEAEEAREPEAYPDPLSPLGQACRRLKLAMHDYRKAPGWEDLAGAPWTIGVGHTGPEVHQGLTWTDAQIDAQLAIDIGHCIDALQKRLPWWNRLTDERQDVLVQMVFQMGIAGVLAFKNTLRLIQAGDYARAADGMLASKWAAQTPNRVKRLAEQMKTGARP